MRYIEILEAQLQADKAARESARKREANQQLEAARRKRTDAARRYQDTLRSSGEAEQKAKAKLAKTLS